MARRDVFLAVLPPVLWALAYTVAKPITDNFPPIMLMCLVYLLTAIALFRPTAQFQSSFWTIFVAASFGCSIQSALIFVGISKVPASLAIFVVQAQVPFAAIAAWAVGKQRIHRGRLVGILVALFGVGLVVGMPTGMGQLGGLLMIVLGTACWGLAQGVIAKYSRDEGPRLMGAMSAVATPELFLLSAFLERGQFSALRDAGPKGLALIVVLALLGFVAAYSIWYSLLLRNRVDQVAPFILLMPVVGLASSYLLLNEQPSSIALLGGLIIFAGLAIIVNGRDPIEHLTLNSSFDQTNQG